MQDAHQGSSPASCWAGSRAQQRFQRPERQTGQDKKKCLLRGVGSDQVKWQHMHSSAAGVAQPLRSSPPTIPGATRRELAPQWAPSEVIHARQRRRSKQSPQQILHLTHLSMASRCGSRAPQLDTALMDSPLVLTREWRPPGQQK